MRGINLIAQQIDTNLYYYTHNAHGDVVQRIRDNGEAAPVYLYDAFGNQKNTVETDPNPFRYCGELYDSETESYYLRARSMVPKNGRFASEDSVRSFSNKMYNGQEITDPLSLNLYTYAYNDPINYVDPSGHFSFLQAIAGAAAIVAGVAMVSIAIAAAPVVVGIAALMAAGAFAAGMMTVMFGANEIAESVTGINHMRYAATGGNTSLDQEYYAVMSAVGITGASMAQGIAPYAQAAQIANAPTKIKAQTMDPNKIRFSQNSIKSTFSDGTSVDSTIIALKDGTLKSSSIEPIRIFYKNGELYTLDNRRLYVVQRAGVQVNYVWATNEQIQNEAWKFTIQNNGTSINVRGR